MPKTDFEMFCEWWLKKKSIFFILWKSTEVSNVTYLLFHLIWKKSVLDWDFDSKFKFLVNFSLVSLTPVGISEKGLVIACGGD